MCPVAHDESRAPAPTAASDEANRVAVSFMVSVLHTVWSAGDRGDRGGIFRGRFKSANRAGLLSLAFPGLGDLYLGHRGLAVVEMFGAASMWFVIFFGFWGSQNTGEPIPAGTLLMISLVAFAFCHGLDALVTRHTGHKGLYPAASA